MLTDMTSIFGVIILIGLGTLIVLQLRSRQTGVDPQELARLRSDISLKTEEMGKLGSLLEKERSEKDELAGNGKQLFSRFKDMEADYKATLHERDELKKRVVEFEAAAQTRERELDERLQKLHRAEKSLEDERMRIRREDEERQQNTLEARDRQWNEHEQNVLALLSDLCKKPETAFPSFNNANLPDEFDGSLKPDFMIGFLQQYVIFDAKISRSENFQNYISTNVKKTAEKCKGNKHIYPTIFFVVPTDAISELKRRSFTENGLVFYIISPESLEPVLASLKKITTYDLAEQLDPQEREKIIHLVASLDHHISARNAFDVIMAQQGSAVLYDAKKAYPDIVEAVEREKSKMGAPSFKPSDVKRLISSLEEREKEIEELTAPKPEIDRRDMRRMQKTLMDA